MNKIVIGDKTFVPYIKEDEILAAVKKTAQELNDYYKDATFENAPVFVSILNGAYMFTSDLMKEINFPCELSFIKVASYESTCSTGKMSELIGFKNSLEGRDVIVIDDIIDTGLTMKSICENIQKMLPNSLKIVGFIHKPHAAKCELNVDFTSIVMKDNAFIIGYGLDYNEKARNLRDIYILD